LTRPGLCGPVFVLGARMMGGHDVEPAGEGTVATLWLSSAGPLGGGREPCAGPRVPAQHAAGDRRAERLLRTGLLSEKYESDPERVRVWGANIPGAHMLHEPCGPARIGQRVVRPDKRASEGNRARGDCQSRRGSRRGPVDGTPQPRG
jgi:hypothetical protein